MHGACANGFEKQDLILFEPLLLVLNKWLQGNNQF